MSRPSRQVNVFAAFSIFGWLMAGVIGLASCSTAQPKIETEAKVIENHESAAQLFAPISAETAQEITRVALEEWALWGKSTVNAQGHLIQAGIAEAETTTLDNGQPAWQRVSMYWNKGVGSARLSMTHRQLGAGIAFDQNGAEVPPRAASRFWWWQTRPGVQQTIERARIIDRPWSAAFVSYVLKVSGVTGSQFLFEDGHIRYIKSAFLQPKKGYRVTDPFVEQADKGDLLCYVREKKKVYDAKNFQDWLTQHGHDDIGLLTHCDVVVDGGETTNGQEMWVVGGNVLNTVTLKKLKMERGILSLENTQNNTASLSKVPLGGCDPLSGFASCNMNVHNWVALLKWRGVSEQH